MAKSNTSRSHGAAQFSTSLVTWLSCWKFSRTNCDGQLSHAHRFHGASVTSIAEITINVIRPSPRLNPANAHAPPAKTAIINAGYDLDRNANPPATPQRTASRVFAP